MAVVMQVNLHFAKARLHQLCEWLEKPRVILFAGEEERVAGRTTACVGEAVGQLGILTAPNECASDAHLERCTPVKRFKVIAHRKEQVTPSLRPCQDRPGGTIPQPSIHPYCRCSHH